MRRFLLASIATTAACVWAASAFAGASVSHGAVMYVDGVQYDVLAAINAGAATAAVELFRFECPVLKLPKDG